MTSSASSSCVYVFALTFVEYVVHVCCSVTAGWIWTSSGRCGDRRIVKTCYQCSGACRSLNVEEPREAFLQVSSCVSAEFYKPQFGLMSLKPFQMHRLCRFLCWWTKWLWTGSEGRSDAVIAAGGAQAGQRPALQTTS